MVYTQVEPFAEVSGDDVIAAIKADPLARHDIPEWVAGTARGVIERCWAPEAAERPSFAEVVQTLTGWYCGDEMGGEAADVYL